MRRSVAMFVAPVVLACTAPPVSVTPTAVSSGRRHVSSVVAVGDSVTVTFTRPMLQIGEGSGVEMSGNYQLDARALPTSTKIACFSRDCLVVTIDLPASTLVAGTQHTLRVANVVAQAGPGIEPDPTTVSFTDARLP